MLKIKGTLVILTMNEIEGLKVIFPLIPLGQFAETIVIDYKSTDGTLEYLKDKKVKIIHQQKRGRGDAFRIAIKEAKYENLVFFSPDGNENPKDIPKLFELLDNGYHMAIASRFTKKSRCDEDDQFIKLRKFGNIMFTKSANFLFRGRLTDSINGFRGIKKQAFKKINPDAEGFGIEFQVSMRAMKKRMKIAEIPTIEKERIGGQSTAGTIKVGSYFVKLMLKEYLS